VSVEVDPATDEGPFRQANRIVFDTQTTGFEHGMEQTVLSGPGLQLLNPSNRDAYQCRMSDAMGPVSELYQVNARWRPADLRRLATDTEQKELRTWFLESGRSYQVAEGIPVPVLHPLASLPQPFGMALTKLAELGKEAGLFYPADIVVLLDGYSWLLPAGADALVRMRLLTPDTFERLAAAVPEGKRVAMAEADCILSITTVPWRLEVSHGPRGYRNAMLETGLLMAQTMQILMQVKAGPTVAVDFVDTVVDGLLDQDGVERFTSALIAVSFSAQQKGPARS
jgi:hypothetical protein